MKRYQSKGFTLLELLIVIAIISLLVQLMTPVVQMAREAARRSQCKNNLRQTALAFQLHETTNRHLPSGGWGWHWTGDAARGFGHDQPGGWVYNVLPYIEQQSLYDSARGTTTDDLQVAQQRMIATPIAVLNCPSRRLSQAYPYALGMPFPVLGMPKDCARTDYAANLGAVPDPKSVPRSHAARSPAQRRTAWPRVRPVPQRTRSRSHYWPPKTRWGLRLLAKCYRIDRPAVTCGNCGINLGSNDRLPASRAAWLSRRRWRALAVSPPFWPDLVFSRIPTLTAKRSRRARPRKRRRRLPAPTPR